ncbi:sporulation protein YunB [Paenibacillus sacheonensis]|uniref:Sporulation protein YunB n=1 Tax=Paenibacillus sacheonensis TaxID=742054 RepID=A0A7X5C0I5_9BACL|nr:sporulation protein YunB [Paenibacillus sacheonensis]MBM7566959.1 sporulation protein YunB [Paenibacillus sacheonensis]NBC71581.1 sporulation protein YunB [Paenibacillus sacheonensis]
MRRWGRRGWRSTGARRRSGGKRGKKSNRRRLIIFLSLLFVLFFFQTFIFIERNLQKPLMTVAQVRVKQEATQAINKSITKQVAEKTSADKLIEWKTNADGKISGFMLNYSEHMRITSETIDTVQTTLDKMGDIPEKIPLGQALGSAIIASFGPRIPVKFEPIGAVKVDLNTRQKDAGINMILVEVYMHIVAEVSIIIPFDTKPELVETEIPISYLLVVGDVPTYYYDNNGNPVGDSAPNAPSIAIPGVPDKNAVSGSQGGTGGEEAPEVNSGLSGGTSADSEDDS